jgi:hypothetical protein
MTVVSSLLRLPPCICHALPLSVSGGYHLPCPCCYWPCYPHSPPATHIQAGIAWRILSKWGQGYADFSGRDDLALIADLSGLNGAKITLAGVTYDSLELALDGAEVYGFRDGEEGFTAIADARVLKRVKKAPLLGVSHDVSWGVRGGGGGEGSRKGGRGGGRDRGRWC